jgi:hypothetical protein
MKTVVTVREVSGKLLTFGRYHTDTKRTAAKQVHRKITANIVRLGVYGSIISEFILRCRGW